eukprot:5095302-Prymnesium_polylepis.2
MGVGSRLAGGVEAMCIVWGVRGSLREASLWLDIVMPCMVVRCVAVWVWRSRVAVTVCVLSAVLGFGTQAPSRDGARGQSHSQRVQRRVTSESRDEIYTQP